MSRPTTYTQARADALLEWMSEGKTVKSWCKANDVGLSTVAQWKSANREFAEAYARAREDQGDAIADDAVDTSEDMQIPSDQKRIIVDTKKWYASKMRPKVYGDRTQLEHSSPPTQRTSEEELEHLVQKAAAHPTQAVRIRAWARELLRRIPPVEGEDP